MKFYLPVIAALLFISCSGGGGGTSQPVADAGKPTSEKNKQIASKNEAVQVTQAAQDLEKQGRQMESYRLANDAGSARQCGAVKEDLQGEVRELEIKINNLPGQFNNALKPIVNDLNACVSCSKTTALASCVKARASINKAIKEIF